MLALQRSLWLASRKLRASLRQEQKGCNSAAHRTAVQHSELLTDITDVFLNTPVPTLYFGSLSAWTMSIRAWSHLPSHHVILLAFVRYLSALSRED